EVSWTGPSQGWCGERLSFLIISGRPRPVRTCCRAATFLATRPRRRYVEAGAGRFLIFPGAGGPAGGGPVGEQPRPLGTSRGRGDGGGGGNVPGGGGGARRRGRGGAGPAAPGP